MMFSEEYNLSLDITFSVQYQIAIHSVTLFLPFIFYRGFLISVSGSGRAYLRIFLTDMNQLVSVNGYYHVAN